MTHDDAATLAQGATARPFGTSRYKARAEQAEADLAAALGLLGDVSQAAWRIQRDGHYCEQSPHSDRCGILVHDIQRAQAFLAAHPVAK